MKKNETTFPIWVLIISALLLSAKCNQESSIPCKSFEECALNTFYGNQSIERKLKQIHTLEPTSEHDSIVAIVMGSIMECSVGDFELQNHRLIDIPSLRNYALKDTMNVFNFVYLSYCSLKEYGYYPMENVAKSILSDTSYFKQENPYTNVKKWIIPID